MGRVGTVARAHRDRDARVVVEARVGGLTGELVRAVAVRDHRRAHHGRFVHRGREVREAVRRGLDEQDLAVRADGRRHVEVEGDLFGPALVGDRERRGGAELVDLREAPVRRRAGRNAEGRAVDGEVGLGVRVVERVDDGDRLALPLLGVELVGRLEVGRVVSRLPGRGAQVRAAGDLQREAARVTRGRSTARSRDRNTTRRGRGREGDRPRSHRQCRDRDRGNRAESPHSVILRDPCVNPRTGRASHMSGPASMVRTHSARICGGSVAARRRRRRRGCRARSGRRPPSRRCRGSSPRRCRSCPW